MNRWMDHRDHFGTIPSSDLDMHRLDWQNRLGGVRTGMFKFSPHNDFGGASNNIESSRTVAKVCFYPMQIYSAVQYSIGTFHSVIRS